MSKLGVNVDHVAAIREARKIDYPDPVEAGLISEKAGADSVVCHLREDRRHIQDKDLYRLKKQLKIKLNLEMAAREEIIAIALDVNPGQITLVPEKRKELTTEGGLDVLSEERALRKVLRRMAGSGIEASLFIEPDKRQIKASLGIGCRMIELHTGSYANAKNKEGVNREFLNLKETAAFARGLGLKVFAGHGLNYENTRMLRKIPEIEEYNIGHSIIARAIFVGLETAVREMKELVI